ncbi:MAG: pitrilysin family protein [Candidatus Kapaibacteriales bacterium]
MKTTNNNSKWQGFFVMFFLGAMTTFMVSCDNKDGAYGETSDGFVLLDNEKDPTLAYNIWFKVGSQDDPAGKEGLAYITAQMITDAGAAGKSLADITEELYPIAAGYGAKVDKEMTVIRGRTHTDNTELYEGILVDAITSPNFDQADLDRIIKNTVSSVEKDLRYSSDEELGKAVLYGEIFEGTPYAHLTMGTVSGLNSITIQDVKDFYAKYYNQNNYVIGMAGNIGGRNETLASKLNEKLPQGEENMALDFQAKMPEGMNVTIVDKDAGATAISMGFPINITRASEDFVALDLFRSWFGEHRNQSSHLYGVIREERGINYGNYAYIDAFLNGGSLSMPNPNNARSKQIFEIWIRPVQPEHRHFALRAALRELKMIMDNGMTQEDFDKTKQFLNKYALNYAPDASTRLGYQIDSKFYGVEDEGDYISYYRNKLSSLKLEDVNNAIKKHLIYGNMQIIAVTKDAEQYKDMLVNNTESPIKYGSEKEQSILDEDKEISTFQLDIKAENVEIVPVDEFFK